MSGFKVCSNIRYLVYQVYNTVWTISRHFLNVVSFSWCARFAEFSTLNPCFECNLYFRIFKSSWIHSLRNFFYQNLPLPLMYDHFCIHLKTTFNIFKMFRWQCQKHHLEYYILLFNLWKKRSWNRFIDNYNYYNMLIYVIHVRSCMPWMFNCL